MSFNPYKANLPSPASATNSLLCTRLVKKKIFNKKARTLFLFSLLLFAQLTSVHLQASEVKILSVSNADTLSEPELYVDEVLDDLLGEDPAIISLEKELGLNQKSESAEQGASASIGVGARNNILELKSPELNSRKLYSYLDYYYTKGREDDDNLLFFIYFENTTYSDIDIAGDVQTFATIFEANKRLTETSMFESTLDYSILVDPDSASAAENEAVTTIRNDDYGISVAWVYKISSRYSTNLGLNWSHSYSEEPVDRYYEIGLSTGLKKEYGEQSEIAIKYKLKKTQYPEDEVTDVDGSYFEGETLETESQTINIQHDHYWLGKSKINLFTELIYSAHKDNGPGYDKYDYLFLGEALQYKTEMWRFEGSLEYTYTQYHERAIETSSGDTEKLFNRELDFVVSIERVFGDDLSIKAELETTKVESNDTEDEYSSNSFLLSSIWYF